MGKFSKWWSKTKETVTTNEITWFMEYVHFNGEAGSRTPQRRATFVDSERIIRRTGREDGIKCFDNDYVHVHAYVLLEKAQKCRGG